MRKQENSTLLDAHFSDIWADAQRSRSILFASLVVKAWRQLFQGNSTDSDRPHSKARQYFRA
jgi:hypothetical protein